MANLIKNSQKKSLFTIMTFVLVIVLTLSLLGAYLVLIKHHVIPAHRILFRYDFVRDFFFEDKIQDLVEMDTWRNEEIDRFKAVWDTTEEIWMSQDMFEPVSMFDKPRYRYKPSLQKLGARIKVPERTLYIEAPDTDQFREKLKATGYPTSINHATFDEHGLRRTSYPPGTDCNITVLFVGDSFTEGLWVNDHETFASQYGELANASANHKICIINSGVNGYGTLEEAYMAETIYKIYPFQVLFVMYFVNDVFEDADDVMMPGRIPNATFAKELEAGWITSGDYLKRLFQFAKERDIQMMLVPIPSKDQFDEPEERIEYQDRLQAFAEKENIPYFDPFYEIEAKGWKQFFFSDDFHFTPMGNKMFAEILFNKTNTSIQNSE